MRTAHILIRKHGSEKWELAEGPGEYPAVKLAFKQFIGAGGTHADVAEAQLFSSDGGREREVRLLTTEAHAAHKDKQAADTAKHLAHLQSLNKKPEPKADKKK